ncbi:MULTISPECIES: hypothetical protein [Microcoleaceae]|uniref:hypothetical protein n=1 Tax=Microcoleaceae TaxID=1892252 RepID=UPI0018822779|nr:hypothetical protein [Tychonema sp. LEGE 06208]MBE9161986.1 hypothetical protein [Tychonema sp. LEGE 06208]
MQAGTGPGLWRAAPAGHSISLFHRKQNSSRVAVQKPGFSIARLWLAGRDRLKNRVEKALLRQKKPQTIGDR